MTPIRVAIFFWTSLKKNCCRQFRTATPRFFVGVSSGGVLATYVAATRSTYCAVVSLDAPVHLEENWLAKKINCSREPGRKASEIWLFGGEVWLARTVVENACEFGATDVETLSRKTSVGRSPDDANGWSLHRASPACRRVTVNLLIVQNC